MRQVYKEIKDLIKKKIVGYLETIEKEIQDCLNEAIGDSDEAFTTFKTQLLKFDASLSKLDKENQQSNTTAHKIHSNLYDIDNQMRELYGNNRVLKSFIDSIKIINFSVNYSRTQLVDTIKFGKLNTYKDTNEVFDYVELARSMIEAETDTTKKIKEPTFFNLAITKSQRESIAHLDVYGPTTERQRTGSLLKSQQSFHIPNYLYLSNLDKGSPVLSSQRKLSDSIAEFESKASIMHTVSSTANLKPIKLQPEPTETKPKVMPLNLYEKQRLSTMKTPKNNLQRQNSVKGLVDAQAINPVTISVTDKSTTLTIRNLTMSQLEFKKTVSDALKKNKLIERVDLRDNVLSFDIAKCIKEMFNAPLAKPLSFDFRRNKVKINPHNFDMVKQQLAKLNVKIIVQ